MGNKTKIELYPRDHPIFSEGLRIYGKPSLPSTKTPPQGTGGAARASAPRKATSKPLSGSPKRKDHRAR